jgi:hypothetical protein
MVLNVWGALNVQPASDAVTVYVFPLASEKEYFPAASVVAVSVAPPLMEIVAPWSAPLGPVTVPLMTSVSALEMTATS